MSSEKQTREGYVCPHCRILFSLPRSMGGNGVYCPGCNTLLAVPLPKDGVASQGATCASYSETAEISSVERQQNELEMRTDDRRDFESEADSVERLGGEIGSSNSIRWMLPLAVIALAIIGGLGYMLLGDPQQPQSVAVPITEEVVEFDPFSSETHDEMVVLLNNLFSADSVDELLPLCRETVGLRERLEIYYTRNGFENTKVKELNSVAVNYTNGNRFRLVVETSDYTQKFVEVTLVDNELKIEWENYTIYSEMTWAEMKRVKPIEPIEMRCIVKFTNFYNGDFNNDEWQSFYIEHPEEDEEILYAYVKKGSFIEQQITNFGVNKNGYEVTVKAHYLENSTTDNQIVISEMINNSFYGVAVNESK